MKIEELKTSAENGAGETDTYVDTKGDFHAKPKGGKGPGEPLGVNRKDMNIK